MLTTSGNPTPRPSGLLAVPASPFASASERRPPLTERPSDASSHGESNSPLDGRGRYAKVPKNSIGIGIETEFLLEAHDHGELIDRSGLFRGVVV